MPVESVCEAPSPTTHAAGTRRLRILMIAPNPFFVDRGFSVHVYEQARALRDLGHHVAFATYHCGRDLEGFPFYRSFPVPWYRDTATGGSLHRLYIDALLAGTSCRACRRERPDVIHGHIHEGALIGLMCRLIRRVPVILDLQGSLVGELDEKQFFRGWRRSIRPPFVKVERWINRRAAHIVTPSQDMVDDLHHRFGIPLERITRTMDGVNTDDFSPRAADPDLAAELGLPPGKKVIVYLGLLMEHQGVDCLLEAAARTLSNRHDHHYLIMGYPNVDQYQQQAGALGIAPHVTFTGRIDYARAADYLALGDIATSPKIAATEGNGKLYNYMAMGLPTVASDRPANREILGDTGLYFPTGCADELAAALRRALDSLDHCHEKGRAARQRVVEQYSWHSVARILEQSYARVLEPAVS